MMHTYGYMYRQIKIEFDKKCATTFKIIIYIASFIVVIIWRLLGKKVVQEFPPGPLNLPLIGGLYRLATDPFTSSLKLWQQFGSIVGIHFGAYRSIIVNDHKLIKDVLTNPAIQARPQNPAWQTEFRVKNGVIVGIGTADGPVFQQNHRLAIKTLKKFGFGSKTMEPAILKKAGKIFKFFDSKFSTTKKSISSDDVFSPYTAHITWSLLARRKMPDELQMRSAIKAFNGIKAGAGTAAIAMLFPWLNKISPNLTGWRGFMDCHKKVSDVIQDCIGKHRRDPCVVENEKDFIDIFLDKINKSTNPSSIFYGELGEFNLNAVVGDLIAGGIDTVAVTMTWTLLLLLHSPVVCEKLQNELDKINLTQNNQLITLESRPRLPYLEAVIKETLRHKPTLPWSIPHRTTEVTQVGAYKIPMGTTVYTNLLALNHDTRIWGDPDSFRPERFIIVTPQDGQNLVKNVEEFIPFSWGRRICPGRYVAQDELFLLLANMLVHFHIKIFPPRALPSLIHLPHIVMTPVTFQFNAVRRNGSL